MKNFTNFYLYKSIAIAFVILFSFNCFSQVTVNCPLVQDGWVSEDYPNNNYDVSGFLICGKEFTGEYEHIYLEFDLSAIPLCATINSATMSITHQAGTYPITFRTVRVTSAWDESTLTWNNRPSDNSPLTIASWTINGPPTTVSNPFTGEVKEWIENGFPNYGTLLKTASFVTNGNYASFWSENGPTPATLSVTYTQTGVSSTPPTSINANPNPVCSGNSTTLTKSGGTLGTGADWYWYSGSCGGTLVGTGNPISVSPTINTTYYVRAEGDCNTTSCASVTITINPLPSAATVSGNASPTINTQETYNASATNATSWSWTLPNGWSGSSTTNSITVTVGNISGNICAIPSNVCGSGNQDCIFLDPSPGVEEIESINNLNIFPNPNKGEFVIEMELAKPQEMELELLNVIGQLVYKEGLGKVSGAYQKQLDLNNLAKGIYTLQLTSEEGTTTRKLMIE